MNPTLLEAINELGMTETEAMNILQNSGTVSDLCVTAADVSNAESDVFKSDVSAAIKYLKMSYGVLI